jgi:serine/threonine protein kinase
MYGHAGYRWSIPIPRVFDHMPLVNGQTFAGYKILRPLGSGGMGDVYLAQHPRLPRQDALKVLAADVSADAEYRARFAREADLASTLWHPNIVGVHDRGEDDGQLWISMDYVEGQDAARLLARQSSSGLRPQQVTKIVSAVANALDFAHERGLLHRDVKPANIMITNDEQRILLADFGIARNRNDISGLTATNFTVGTMAYAAPEQLMGEDLDGRADQYALAATTYYLLTGSHLFPHSNPAVVIGRHLNAAPPALADARPELAALDSVLAIALAKDPSNRFRDCKEFARALSLTRVEPVAGQNQRSLTTTRAAAVKKAAPSARPAASVKEPTSSPQPATHTKKATGAARPPTEAAPAPRSQAPQQTRPAIRKHWPLMLAVLALTIAVIGVVALLNSTIHGAKSPGLRPTTSAVPPNSWTEPPWGPTIPRTPFPQTVLPFTGLFQVYGVAVGGNGTVYVGYTTNQGLVASLAVDATSQTVLAQFGMNSPQSVAVDDSGTVYVSDSKRVVALPAGAITPTVLPFTGLTAPKGVAVDNNRTVYVTDGDRVLALAAGGTTPTVLPFTDVRSPFCVAVDKNRTVYVSDSKRVVALPAGATTPTVLPFTGLGGAAGVAVDSKGTVYVADAYNDQVMALAADATSPTVLPFTGLKNPKAVAVDGIGNVYVADYGNNRVVKVASG